MSTLVPNESTKVATSHLHLEAQIFELFLGSVVIEGLNNQDAFVRLGIVPIGRAYFLEPFEELS
jgi:hypothetical protein